MTLTGIDISSWQPVIHWPDVAAAGVGFAVVKASGGAGYRNPHYREQVAGARAAGLAVAHYHYAFEGVAGADPLAEAAHFLATIDRLPGEPIALDLEEQGGPLADWALAWLGAVAVHLGVAPLLYTYPNFMDTHGLHDARLAAYPLWYASYRETPPPPPAPWPAYAIWQYTADGHIPGIPAVVDLNRFAGDAAAFRAIGGPAGGQAHPADPGFPGALHGGRVVLGEVDFGPDEADIVCVEKVQQWSRNDRGERYTRVWDAHRLTPWVRTG